MMPRRRILVGVFVSAIVVVTFLVSRGPLLRQAFAPTAVSTPGGATTADVLDGAAEAPDEARLPIEVVAEGLEVPWDIAFLPEGDLLVTERSGTLKRLSTEATGRAPITITVPDVLDTGEGGLMGMVLHPDFVQNRLLYLYFTTSEGGQHNRVARFRLDGESLTDERTILDGIPSAIYHDGGRIAFGPDGMLYITTGDATDSANAQDLGSLAGKTLRLTADGGIPGDNPFGTAVWSYGHRNAQGLAWDNQGRLWETEHGRSGITSGYDELNLVEKGKNYGWPVIQGPATREGMVAPVVQSGASETWAPASAAYHDGSIWFGGLRGESLYEARIGEDGRSANPVVHFHGEYGRIRAVVVGPDGYLYLTTSNRDGRGSPVAADDRIIRVDPAALRP